MPEFTTPKTIVSLTKSAGFAALYAAFFAARNIGEPKLELAKRLYWAERETVAAWNNVKAMLAAGAADGQYTPKDEPAPGDKPPADAPQDPPSDAHTDATGVA